MGFPELRSLQTPRAIDAHTHREIVAGEALYHAA